VAGRLEPSEKKKKDPAWRGCATPGPCEGCTTTRAERGSNRAIPVGCTGSAVQPLCTDTCHVDHLRFSRPPRRTAVSDDVRRAPCQAPASRGNDDPASVVTSAEPPAREVPCGQRHLVSAPAHVKVRSDVRPQLDREVPE
jgi:hypothetical protein